MKIHESITEARVLEACERASKTTDNPGFCVRCGADAEGVEPDAERYMCEECDRPGVYGAEQLLLLISGY